MNLLDNTYWKQDHTDCFVAVLPSAKHIRVTDFVFDTAIQTYYYYPTSLDGYHQVSHNEFMFAYDKCRQVLDRCLTSPAIH